jgi:transcriptional regulator NrdR family protein
MNCSHCGGDTCVIITNYNTDTNERYRRRKCKTCGRVIWTIEFEVEFDDAYRNQWNDCERMKRGTR